MQGWVATCGCFCKLDDNSVYISICEMHAEKDGIRSALAVIYDYAGKTLEFALNLVQDAPCSP